MAAHFLSVCTDGVIPRLINTEPSEKQVVPPPYGVNADGVEDKHSLRVRG